VKKISKIPKTKEITFKLILTVATHCVETPTAIFYRGQFSGTFCSRIKIDIMIKTC